MIEKLIHIITVSAVTSIFLQTFLPLFLNDSADKRCLQKGGQIIENYYGGNSCLMPEEKE